MDSFLKLLNCFPDTLDHDKLACENFYHYNIDVALRSYVLEQAPRYINYMLQVKKPYSLQHFLVYLFFAKDYNSSFTKLDEVYTNTEKKSNIKTIITNWIKKEYKDQDVRHLAMWYLKFMVLKDQSVGFKKYKFSAKLLKQIEELKSGKKDASKKIKSVKIKKKRRNTKQHIRLRASVENLVLKLEMLCVNQKLKKIPLVLEVPESEILDLSLHTIKTADPNHRLTTQEFNLLKPELIVYLNNIISELPEKKMVEESKFSVLKNQKSSNSKSSNYKGFIKIIYTNM